MMPPQHRSGIALIEAVMSIMVVSVMLVAAMQLVVSSRQASSMNENRLVAHALASELMAEILDKPYRNATSTDNETAAVNDGRTSLTSVADYHGWMESPPQHADGLVMSHLAQWSRSVEVVAVIPESPDLSSQSDLGVKRITVVVSRNQAPLARLTAIRAAGVRPQ
jgi:type II secretory pathway pseudopilin PulG